MTEATMPHELRLKDRGALTMTGVTEVVSFDESAVVLRTSLGALMVQGRELHLKTLSPSVVHSLWQSLALRQGSTQRSAKGVARGSGIHRIHFP